TEGIAARVLSSLGLNITRARAMLIRMLANPQNFKSQETKEESDTPTLDSLATNLTKKASDGSLDPVIGRSDEITRVIEVLSRRTKNNTVLIGEPGDGKIDVAECLDQQVI